MALKEFSTKLLCSALPMLSFCLCTDSKCDFSRLALFLSSEIVWPVFGSVRSASLLLLCVLVNFLMFANV